MPLDPTVKLSVTVPYSLSTDLEAALNAGAARSRSQAVTLALRLWLAKLRDDKLRLAVGGLTDDDNPDEDYVALRGRS